MKNLDLNYPHAFDEVWDNIEIERCQTDEKSTCVVHDEEDFKDTDFWSVYVHQAHSGGVMCIADLPTEKDAEDLKVLLSKAVKTFLNDGYLNLYDNKHLQEEFNKQLDNAIERFDPNNLGYVVLKSLKDSFNKLFI